MAPRLTETPKALLSSSSLATPFAHSQSRLWRLCSSPTSSCVWIVLPSPCTLGEFLFQQHPILSPVPSTPPLATVSFLNYRCNLQITLHDSPLSPINSLFHTAARVWTTSCPSWQPTNGFPSCSGFVLIPYPSLQGSTWLTPPLPFISPTHQPHLPSFHSQIHKACSHLHTFALAAFYAWNKVFQIFAQLIPA